MTILSTTLTSGTFTAIGKKTAARGYLNSYGDILYVTQVKPSTRGYLCAKHARMV